jgi:hypothetical protein
MITILVSNYMLSGAAVDLCRLFRVLGIFFQQWRIKELAI